MAILVAGAAVAGSIVYYARTGAGAQGADSEIIAREVQRELKRQLNEGGLLARAVQNGIEAYIRERTAAARTQERTERARLAGRLRPVSLEQDHIYGDARAPVSLVEYSDFECPFCKRFHPTVKRLVEQNAGKVNWIYRHFPLEFHNPGTQKQAEASECAAALGGNEAFWRYADLIYERTTSNGRGFPVDRLVPLAEEIGLDAAAFRECLDSGRMTERVKQDYEDGAKAGVTGTPGTIFVNHGNGDVVASAGAVPLSKLQAVVDRLLAKGDRK